MTLKNLLLGVLCLTIATIATAQDRIYKRNGDIVLGKVIKVTRADVIYMPSEGRRKTAIDRRRVQKIRYENGLEDEFTPPPDHELRTRSGALVVYNKNIIGTALQLTEYGAGWGLSYERVLDKTGLISLYIPAGMVYAGSTGPFNDLYARTTIASDPLYYAMPGIKIYPTTMQGRVKYAIGPSLLFAKGKQTEYVLAGPNTQKTDRIKLGALINNTMNINIDKDLYLGLELGFGFTYLNREDNIEKGIHALVQGAVRVGYRF